MKVFPSDGKLITASEAHLLVAIVHLRHIANALHEVHLFTYVYEIKGRYIIYKETLVNEGSYLFSCSIFDDIFLRSREWITLRTC